jgi:thiol-disulfide isomerase/thioredoxin
MLDAEAKQAFAYAVVEKIGAGPTTPLEVSILQLTALKLDNPPQLRGAKDSSAEDDAFLAKLLEAAIPKLKSDNKEVQEELAGANFEGMLNRLKLVGNPIEISGDLLGGGVFDMEQFRGKVVLVDYWATWCGPCIRELPNVLRLYRAYHDKGFEVIGVNIDQEPEEAKEFIRTRKLPWDSIYSKNEEERDFNHPLAKRYGLSGIPTAILVNQEGKVVHLDAHGETLEAELKKLLGEPAKPAAEKEAVEATASGAES